MAGPRVDASVSPPNHRTPSPCLLPPHHRHLSTSTSSTNPPKPNSSTIAPTSGRRLYPLISGRRRSPWVFGFSAQPDLLQQLPTSGAGAGSAPPWATSRTGAGPSSAGVRRILKQRLKEGSPKYPCLEIAAGDACCIDSVWNHRNQLMDTGAKMKLFFQLTYFRRIYLI
ncbi:hypothetical protein GUJ93_ZPchr0005g14924 [Zizania palustris]|uniref:Uncharacterized protein n=1 Tax=Zizania palustris TaxID=103762 RepID=A0A8J5SY86_ZIZPA|nr:hypothetical protein GUJ93_ZPchr0005g14924 [Zizania palustris]